MVNLLNMIKSILRYWPRARALHEHVAVLQIYEAFQDGTTVRKEKLSHAELTFLYIATALLNHQSWHVDVHLLASLLDVFLAIRGARSW
jgi:hypothetical protein